MGKYVNCVAKSYTSWLFVAYLYFRDILYKICILIEYAIEKQFDLMLLPMLENPNQ